MKTKTAFVLLSIFAFVSITFTLQKPVLAEADVMISLGAKSDTTVTIEGVDYTAVFPGSTFQYTLRLENLSNNVSDSIEVRQILPQYVTFLESIKPPRNIDGQYLEWKADSLQGGEHVEWPISVQLHPSVPANISELTAQAVCYVENDSFPKNNLATNTVKVLRPVLKNTDVSITVEPIADTVVTRNGENYPAVFNGDDLGYILTLTNHGPHRAKNIDITGTWDALVDVIRASHEPDQKDSRLEWQLNSLPANSDTSLNVTIRTGFAKEQPLTFTGTISSETDTTADNNSSSLTAWILQKKVPYADLLLIYNAETDSAVNVNGEIVPAVFPDELFHYNMSVTNDGPGTAKNISLSTHFPGETLVFSTFSEPPVIVNRDSMVWHRDQLTAAREWHVSVGVKIKKIPGNADLLTTQANVRADNDSILENNSQQQRVFVLTEKPPELPDLTVWQTVNVDSVYIQDSDTTYFAEPGDTIQYTFVVFNKGEEPAQNVSLTNVKSRHMQWQAFQPEPAQVYGDTVAWTMPTLPGGGAMPFQVETFIPDTVSKETGVLENVVFVSADNEDSTALANNISRLNIGIISEVTEPFEPLIDADPIQAGISDSISIKVLFPEPVESWDIWIHLPNGHIIKDFADEFIANTTILANLWYHVDSYRHKELMDQTKDNVIFEVRATATDGRKGRASVSVQIQSEKIFLLDRNVFKPDMEPALQIKFRCEITSMAKLDLYDVSGRHLTELVRQNYTAGWHTLKWDGRLENGQKAGSGLYLIILDTGSKKVSKKIIIVR